MCFVPIQLTTHDLIYGIVLVFDRCPLIISKTEYLYSAILLKVYHQQTADNSKTIIFSIFIYHVF